MFSRNLVKEKADKRQGLRHRWLKHYRSFASLAEDQSRGTEKVASILDLSDSKIKQNEETQEKTVRRLLSSMFANAVGSSPRPIEDISVNREISTIKADLRDMRTVLDDTKSNKRKTLKYGTPPDDFEQKLRDLAANSITKSAMTEYESKIAQLTVNLSILQNSFSQHENAFAQLPHLQDLIYKLNSVLVEFGQPKEKSADLSARIDDQNHRLQALSDEEQNHYRVLKDDLNEQKNRLQFLSNEVTGCPEKEVKGLFEYITEGRERHDKMQNAMENAIQNLDSELEGFANKMEQVEAKMQNSPATARLESDLDGFKQRIETLEMSLGLLQEREAKPDANPVEPSGGADLADLNKQMQDEVAHLKAKLVDIEQQQDEKDDAVSTEVEKLYASLKLHANETKQLQEEISALRSQVAAPVLNNPLPPPSPVEKSPKVEELLLPKIQAMENDIKKFKEPLIHRTDAMEVLVESLQQRFDNLSTEHLATCIIHQMQKLYPPHPGNVQNEFTQIKNRLGMMDGSIYALWAELAKVNARIEQQAQIAPSLKTEMLETVEGKLKDFAAKKCNGDTGLHDLEGRLSLLLKDSLQKFEQLEQKFTDFKKNSVESYSSLYKNYQELKISVNSQSLQLLTLVGNMTASRVDPTSEKTPTDKELGNMGPGLKMGEKDFVRERSAANVSVPVQKQHTQIDNPTIGAVMTAVTTAATGAAEAEKQPQRQEESTSTPTTDNTTLPEAQSADKKVGGAEASSTPKEAPLSSKRSPDVPLDADPLKGHSSPRTNSNKRNRYSMDGGDDTDSSSEDARPMKIRRRRVSNNAQPQPEPQPQPQTVKDSQRTCSSDDTENDLERPRGLS
jgi:predicted  nucleic acid-binding Zn-ribbon protein